MDVSSQHIGHIAQWLHHSELYVVDRQHALIVCPCAPEWMHLVQQHATACIPDRNVDSMVRMNVCI